MVTVIVTVAVTRITYCPQQAGGAIEEFVFCFKKQTGVGGVMAFFLRLLSCPVQSVFPASLASFFSDSFFFFFWLFRASPAAYGSSQARGQIGVIAASLHHRHSNARSELCLQPTPQLTATP